MNATEVAWRARQFCDELPELNPGAGFEISSICFVDNKWKVVCRVFPLKHDITCIVHETPTIMVMGVI